jgi:adenine phosphoribosyltransferase
MAIEEDLIRSFRWIDGHADVWRWFSNGELLRRIVQALAAPFSDGEITMVAAVESRGLLLAGAITHELGAGVVGIRKDGGPLPGPKSEAVTAADYRGRRLTLQMQAGVIASGDRVLLVDDWIETRSQALAASELIVREGASFMGLAAIVRDGTSDEVIERLQLFHALIDVEALGPPDALPSRP